MIDSRPTLESLAHDVERLKRQVRDLEQRTSVAAAAAPPKPAPTPVPPPQRLQPEATLRPFRDPAPAPPTPPAAHDPGPSRSFDWGRDVDVFDLLGAKALAWAGGVVTLLGVVFFFVLAANRGWIGPGIRIACGATASALVFTVGFWLRRRFGETFSSLAAVGAGIAGAYATLLAAASLYDLVSKPAALLLAAAIAAAGLAVSLLWSSQMVASLGLVGAMVVPGMLLFQGGLTPVGTAFVAVMFAAAAGVAVRRSWRVLLCVSGGVSALQAMLLFADRNFGWDLVALAAAFWLLYLATGLAAHLAEPRERPHGRTTGFLLGSAPFAAYSAAMILGDRHEGRDQGIALLAAGAVYAATAVPLSLRHSGRTVSAILYALSLTAGAVGLGDVLSGATLTYVWAGEAALLAWLAARIRDARFQVAAVAYLILAGGHALLIESQPDLLFVAHRHPGSGAPTVVAVALAALLVAMYVRADTNAEVGVLAPLVAWWRAQKRVLHAAASTAAVLAGIYAGSLAILELAQAAWVGTTREDFQRGHVLVTGMWALAGLVALVALIPLLRGRAWLGVYVAFGWLGATTFKTIAFDANVLPDDLRATAFLAVASTLLLAGIAIQVALPGRLDPIGTAAVLLCTVLAPSGSTTLLEGQWLGLDLNGVAVALVAVVLGASAAAIWRVEGMRDFRTLLGTIALALAAAAEAMLFHGVWLVLAWTMTAAALAVLTIALAESRLQLASAAYLLLSAGAALGLEAPPSHLVVARDHPARGVTSIVLLVAALAVFAWSCRPSAAGDLQSLFRRVARWAAGALGLSAASLFILEIVSLVSTAGVATDFQRGHTAVSALWGVLGLAFLYLGLTRQRRGLRLAGFALFAISLGKLFLYDLAALSSITRALSFLAVGAVLLVGGFFYQRLSAQVGRDSPA